ncbi:unnamed protein product [Amoebophrya sp. A25]|nr:unnamed protein product [Amoebophrya sp. A25]|eukprot:GSA25T00025750001.1
MAVTAFYHDSTTPSSTGRSSDEAWKQLVESGSQEPGQLRVAVWFPQKNRRLSLSAKKTAENNRRSVHLAVNIETSRARIKEFHISTEVRDRKTIQKMYKPLKV